MQLFNEQKRRKSVMVIVTDRTFRHVYILLAVHRPCSIAFVQVRDAVWLTSTSQVRFGRIRPLCLRSVADHEPHCRPVSDRA